MRRPFLTASWTDLVILNYEVPPAVVLPLVPRGTELDIWQGQALVSLVGFLFTDTRVRGLAIPWHRHFEEVNLRFYVRRRVASAPDRRAVVFVRELVPRYAIAAIARFLYNEPYRRFRCAITEDSTRIVAATSSMRGATAQGTSR